MILLTASYALFSISPFPYSMPWIFFGLPNPNLAICFFSPFKYRQRCKVSCFNLIPPTRLASQGPSLSHSLIFEDLHQLAFVITPIQFLFPSPHFAVKSTSLCVIRSMHAPQSIFTQPLQQSTARPLDPKAPLFSRGALDWISKRYPIRPESHRTLHILGGELIYGHTLSVVLARLPRVPSSLSSLVLSSLTLAT